MKDPTQESNRPTQKVRKKTPLLNYGVDHLKWLCSVLGRKLDQEENDAHF